ncbi:MAG: peptidoglycan-binding protein [Thermoleophilia bacterium]
MPPSTDGPLAVPALMPSRHPAEALTALVLLAIALLLSLGLTATASAAPTRIPGKGLLERGDEGKAVRAVQRAVGIPADGVYGPRTVKAVKRFQERAGLAADGRVGPRTRRALNGVLAARSAPRSGSGVLRLGDSGAAVVRLQRLLRLPADGVFGKETRKAVKRFQRRAGLTVDGKVGPQTLRALQGISAARVLQKSTDGVLRMGDSGPAVARLQRALGITPDGVFGKGTRKAVKRFQRAAGLTADGIVGPGTLAALARTPVRSSVRAAATSRTKTTRARASRATDAPAGFDDGLAAAIALARQMGLEVISGYRPGATIGGSGRISDHAFNPSKAADVAGSAAEMKRYALAVAGLPGVETVIYASTGLWLAGRGWGDMSPSTAADHVDHVHVDTF